jgi:FkbM family methyltransferase
VNDKVVWFKPFGQRSFKITGDDRDAGVVGEIDRSGGRYQNEFGLFARRILEPDSVVVDGGAHIGVLTLLLASLCPAGHVYAFEPAAANRRHLDANLVANEVTNVTVEEAALYGSDGDVVFDSNSAYPAGSHIGTTGTTVAAVRVDTWARKNGIERLDLLKLDVEGSEVGVLGGAEQTIRRFRPTTVIECNPVALRRFGGGSHHDLVSAMKALFPIVAILGPGGAVIPILSETHLDLLLADQGVTDLIGLAPRNRIATAVDFGRSLCDFLRLSWRYNRRRPAENKVVEPVVSLATPVTEIAGEEGRIITVPTTVVNRSRWWLSSAFPYHPVHVSYRVLDSSGSMVTADGHRTSLPSPLGPGRSVTVDVTVELPHRAGEYQLAVTLVQEAFAWFDELNPDCTLLVPMRVGRFSD